MLLIFVPYLFYFIYFPTALGNQYSILFRAACNNSPHLQKSINRYIKGKSQQYQLSWKLRTVQGQAMSNLSCCTRDLSDLARALSRATIDGLEPREHKKLVILTKMFKPRGALQVNHLKMHLESNHGYFIYKKKKKKLLAA